MNHAVTNESPAATLPDGTALTVGDAAPLAPGRWIIFGRKDTPGAGTTMTIYGYNAEGTALTTFASRTDAEHVARALANAARP